MISNVFTAQQWVELNALDLTQRQRICFYKEIASAHRLLIGSQPQKMYGYYWYTSKHEILFEHARYVARAMIQPESKTSKHVIKPKLSPLELKLMAKKEKQMVKEKKIFLEEESKKKAIAQVFLRAIFKGYSQNHLDVLNEAVEAFNPVTFGFEILDPFDYELLLFSHSLANELKNASPENIKQLQDEAIAKGFSPV